ncbi:D-alanine--D-alanine ligase [Candidatus Gottesmanbacteria bacterium]|nr:D-alanine--D-alanine ligase [Candidatus Gottesmanbacteria bacterium]
MRIAFIFNVRHMKQGLGKKAQEEAEFDEPATIAAIHNAIVANGYEVTDIEADEDAYDKLKTLRENIDLVFNIAEGNQGEMREAQMPAILEFLGIPYTHSGALAQAISLDKSLTKKVWQYHGLPTPKFVEIGFRERPYVEGLEFPVIVKPNSEGSSKGIFNDNIIEEPSLLLEKIHQTRKSYGNGVLVEEFLPGREFTVTVMGNPSASFGNTQDKGSGQVPSSQPYVLPIVEQNFDVFPKNLRKFSSYEAKWFFEDTLPDARIAYHCPAKLDGKLQKLIEQLCIQAFVVLRCRDVARIDLRLDANGRPHLLEINTLPGMMPGLDVVSYFPVAARAAGIDFTQMVGRVIAHARERLGI